MNKLTDVICDAVKGSEQTGSDYTARVTRVEGSTAYVQITGSDIADTPVAMSIAVEPGDMVRVRVADGKAWITGNDTQPPGNNKKLVLSVDGKMDNDMGNRASVIVIEDGTITFKSNTIVIESKNFQLDDHGNAVFSGKLEAASGSFEGNVAATNIKALGSYYIYLDPETIMRFAYYNPGRPELSEPPYLEIGDIDKKRYIAFDDNGVAILTSEDGPWVDINGVQIRRYSYWGDLLASKITTYEFINHSDAKLKKNIRLSDVDALSAIRKAQLYSFDWKNAELGHVDIGLIANQLQECVPEAVKDGYMPSLVADQEKHAAGSETEKETIKQIDIIKLLPYLIKAIQQLADKADDQEKRITALEEKINNIANIEPRQGQEEKLNG